MVPSAARRICGELTKPGRDHHVRPGLHWRRWAGPLMARWSKAMSLSEKLERAKKQRLLEAGLLNSADVLKPEPAPVLEDPVWSPVEVEVQPIGLHSVIDDDEE